MARCADALWAGQRYTTIARYSDVILFADNVDCHFGDADNDGPCGAAMISFDDYWIALFVCTAETSRVV